MSKTYLVTGGAGFIGSNFIIFMLKKYGKNITVINLDKLTYAGNLENLHEVEKNINYTFIKGDICNKKLLNKIFSSQQVDYIVNFAAESHVDRSILSADKFIKTNVMGTLALLEIAKQQWETEDGYREGVKFLQVSTDEVYGSLGENGYFVETTPLDPHSPYSASKASADLLVKSFFDTHNMPINITRCSNNYGPYQFPEKFIPLLISNCLQKKKLPVYGDGLNVRDWLYVEDHCRAIDLVINRGKLGEIYNIGGNNEKTNLFIVKTIISYLKEHHDKLIDETLIQYVADRKGHDRRYAIDASKIFHELGWKPNTPFKDGISKTINWYVDNREWLDKIKEKNVK